MLFAASALVYINSLDFSLTGCDDKLLLGNAALVILEHQDFFAFINSPYLFSDGLFYRPIVNASVLLTSLAGGGELYLHYVFNILVHSLTVIFLYLILIKFNSTHFQSLMMSMIFAVHPVLVNSVSWIPGRNDSLLALFILVSFLGLIMYSESGNIMYLAIHGLGFIAALFSKETAVAAIFIFSSYLILFRKSFFKKKIYVLVPVWLVLIFIWFFFRQSVVTQAASYDLFRNMPYFIIAIGKTILPVNLTVLPVIKDSTFLYGIFSIIVLAVLFWYSESKNNRIVLLGLLWFFAFLLPGLININPEYSGDIMIESRLYLPAIGIFILLTQTDLAKKLTFANKYLIGLYVLILGLFCYSNVKYSHSYHDSFSFWQDAAVNSVSLDLAQAGFGSYFLQTGNYETAVEYYKKAIELNRGNVDFSRKTAFCLTRLNRTDEAAMYYAEVLNKEPGDYDANLIMGIINFKKNNLIEAETQLLKAEFINNNDIQPKIYLLKLYRSKGDNNKAAQYENTLKTKGYIEPPK